MNANKKIPFLLTLALLVAGYFTIGPATKAADTPAGDSERVSQLLSDVKAEALQLERDADDLKAFTQSSLSYGSHAAKITQISEHINKAGQLLKDLNDSRASASPWQQKAIDEIYPLLKELDDNTEATINYLNDHQGHIHVSSEYRDYVAENYSLATELAALITDYVDYGKHEAEFQRLREKLEIAKR